jgi:two-component system, CAI-1 autoinducer sensor kinase/phosphatase CqsS
VSAPILRYQFRALADRSLRYSERNLKLFGAIATFLVPASTVIERLVSAPAFETLYIRALAACVGLLLLFHDRLPEYLQRNYAMVWIFAATFILPFCFGAILTLNAALTPQGESPSSIWVYQYLVALFIFIQLINHGALTASLWGIATALVFALCLPLDSINKEALQAVWLYPLPVYLTALFIGSVTNRNVHMVQAEQLRAASAIGANIAHELRTPLASIRALAHGTSRFMPILTHAYDEAKAASIPLEPIAPHQLRELRAGLDSIQSEVEYSNTIIDMLLMNTSEKPISRHVLERFWISEVLTDAIARFPFNNSEERRLITASVESDFEVVAPKVLVVHVLFNLIKNGIYYAQKARPGSLTLLASAGTKNTLEVTDRGPGIPVSLQSRIFDRFAMGPSTSQGAGVGLSFCKMVMDSIGGDIQCESREGEYTTFRLTFPMVDSEAG